MSFKNIVLIVFLLVVGGVTGLFVLKPEIPQKGCDFFFTSQFESYLMGTQLLMQAAMVPRVTFVQLGFADDASLTYYHY